jgi:hypothetical protein
VFSYNSLRSLLLFGDFRAGLLEDLAQHVGRERLGALERQAESTRPDELADAAESSRNAKENRVVVHLRHAVVREKDTAVRVHVGPRVLGLALLEKNRRNDLVEVRDELEQRVVGQVLLGKLSLAHVARDPSYGELHARSPARPGPTSGDSTRSRGVSSPCNPDQPPTHKQVRQL